MNAHLPEPPAASASALLSAGLGTATRDSAAARFGKFCAISVSALRGLELATMRCVACSPKSFMFQTCTEQNILQLPICCAHAGEPAASWMCVQHHLSLLLQCLVQGQRL